MIALCLALSETLGKGAQTESISKNVEASNLWAFFQAKSIRRTVVQTASEQSKLSLGPRATMPPRRRCKSRSTTGRRPRRAIAPSLKPAKGRSNCPNAPSTPRKSAIWRRQNIITTNSPPRHSRSASCWLGDHHHRHRRAGLDLRAADTDGNRIYRARHVRAASAASALSVTNELTPARPCKAAGSRRQKPAALPAADCGRHSPARGADTAR